jgi:PadR family transcriptional regulator PadR
MTAETMTVLSAFLIDPLRPRYGLEIAREAGLASGTLYPILARLERDGLLSSEWEEIDPVQVGRRPRRYYRLTGEGETVAREALDIAARRLNLRPWIPAAG